MRKLNKWCVCVRKGAHTYFLLNSGSLSTVAVRLAVNQKVGGSTPPGSDFFCAARAYDRASAAIIAALLT